MKTDLFQSCGHCWVFQICWQLGLVICKLRCKNNSGYLPVFPMKSNCLLGIFLHATKSLQSCPTLCHPIDGSPPGSPVPGILHARTLEWVAISFSSAGKWKVKVKSLSPVRLLATPWTAAYQAPPSMGFSRQEYWGGVPLPSPISPYMCTEKVSVMQFAFYLKGTW